LPDGLFNTFALGLIQALRTKTARLYMALRWNFFSPVSAADPVKNSRLVKSCSLHSKKIFWLGVWIFCE